MRLAISGLGLTTAVGAGASGSCAALRAGLSMPAELPDLEVDDGEGEGEVVSAVGYPTGLADGFFQAGAWVRLAALAVQDLFDRSPARDHPALLQRAGLSAIGPLVLLERHRWTLAEVPGGLLDHFAAPVAAQAALTPPPGELRAFGLGHPGLAVAIGVAEEALRSGRVDRVLVAAADSYLDPLALEWFAESRRLKTGDAPTGLMPGEAGTALLLETDRAARARSAEVLGHVEAVAVGRPIPPDPPPRKGAGQEEREQAVGWQPPLAAALGRSVAELVRRVLPPLQPGLRWHGDLYLDLNGEDWRAAGWGYAQVHLTRQIDLDRCRTFLPALSLGDTGAASAPIAVSLALWNFRKDGTSEAIVVSVADDGQAAAIRLGAQAKGVR